MDPRGATTVLTRRRPAEVVAAGATILLADLTPRCPRSTTTPVERRVLIIHGAERGRATRGRRAS
jgi:hypothetical protein